MFRRNPSYLFALASIFAATQVHATTFTVTRFDDAGAGFGNPGDLRSSILNANAAGGAGNTIVFTCSSAPCTIVLHGPLPPITSNLTIDGGTFGQIIIDGNNLYRVFFVDTGTVALKHLQIQNAVAHGGNGGLGSLACGGGGAGLGAGLFVNGITAAANVTVTEVFFFHNTATGGNGCTAGGNGDAGGGGGLGGDGGLSEVIASGPKAGVYTNGGGGGVLGAGANGSTTTTNGAAGGLGGGGGSDQNGDATATGGTGGAAYASNTVGGNGSAATGGAGGFGGGGGGGVAQGGNGGFGGGGGGSEAVGGGAGPGGGGGGGKIDNSGAGGVLVGAVTGGAGGPNAATSSNSGGGAAAGPDIFVNQGSLTTVDSGASGGSASGGTAGTGASAGTADSTAVFNFNGTVNGSATKGPVPGALSNQLVSTLSFSAPPSVTAGTSFSFNVTALNQANATDTNYNGTVHFTSSDGQAILPADVTFTNGVSGTLSATLKTVGSQTITATDTATGAITGSVSINVNPGPATHFSVSAPSTANGGVAFSFTVTALDQFNNTATGYTGTVHFSSSDGAASLPADSILNSGVRTFSATLNTGGSQTITATDTATASINGTSNIITVTAAAATHFSVSAPSSATAGTAFNFTVTALDQFNNPATTYSGTVHFTSTDGAATLPANLTLNGGVGTFSATLKTAGTQTITATDTSKGSITGTSNSITVSAAAATHFAVTAPPTATAGVAFNFTVTALDQFNNTATGYGGTVHFSSTDGAASLPANSILASGVGSFSATLKTAGVQTITATDTVTASITGTSNSITVSAAAATHFSVSAPGGATAGVAFNFSVTALDAFNNTATAYGGTVHFSSTDGAATLPANSTLAAGVGSFSATLKTAGSQTITATDTVTASITGTSNSITVSAAAATHFSVSAPGGTTAGVAFNFSVTALDAFNNTATAYGGTVHFSSTDGAASLPANSILASGVGSFSATLKTAGVQTITATDTVTASITGTSNSITVSAAAATHFSVSAPVGATAGVAFNFSVTALDAFNNTATAYGGTVHFSSTDGMATLPGNSTLASGVGSFSATLKTAGSQTITATDTVTASITGTSNSIAVSAAAATHFAVSAPGGTTAGVAFNITVTALDQFNNTATTYAGTVRFGSTDPLATVPANSTLTSGVGTFSATLRTAGGQTISATDTVNAGIAGTSNTITVAPAAATHFLVSAPTTTVAGVAFNFTVTALDPFNNIASGYSGTVHFTSSDSAATLPANSTLAAGVGTFSATLKTAGSQTITATDTVNSSITGTSNPITAVAPAATSHFVVTAPSTATTGNGFSFSVVAEDAFNNVTPGYSGTVRFSSTDGSSVFLQGASTLANGIGTFTVTLRTPGTQTISATDSLNSSITGTSGPIQVTSPPAINGTVAPTSLNFQYFLGTNPSALAATVTVGANVSSSFSVVNPVPWLTISGGNGAAPGSFTVTPNPTGLATGVYQTVLSVNFSGGGAASVLVTLQVLAIQVYTTPPSLSFTAQAGSTTTQTVNLAIQALGENVAASAAASGAAWLTATGSGATPFSAQVTVNPTGLAAGTYTGNVVITSALATNSPLSVPVTFTITSTAPVISIAAIVNGASMQPGPAAPNTIVSAFGTFPGCNAGAQATVDGNATSVFASTPTQINFLVPSSVGSETSANVQISCAGLTSTTVPLPISAVDPALFTSAQSGTGQAAIVNQDGTIDTTSTAGNYLQVYGTGFGPFAPIGSDGLAHLALGVTATIGGVPATVLYAGEAPGYTNGLQQINVLIPANAPIGPSVPLVLTVGGVATQTGVTIGIH